MPAPFDYPGENVTNIMDLVTHVDGLLGGILGYGLLVVIGVVAFLSTKNYSWERSMGFSMFLVFICAIFLRMLSLLDNTGMIIVTILTAIAGIFLLKEREEPGM
jgi:hypothetical protein